MSYCLLEGEAEQLCCAVRMGMVSDLQALLDTGVNINTEDQNGETALHTAIHREHDEMVQELLNRGANPNIQNKNGQTPLHLAASYGYDRGVAMLTDGGADMALTTQFSEMTALHLASKNGHAWIVEHLLDREANIMALDFINKPPEYYAATPEIEQLFAKHSNSDTPITTPHQDHDSSVKNSVTDLQADSSAEEGDSDTLTKRSRKKLNKKASKSHLKDQKMEFSEKHIRRMQISVFDRLTRSKTKLDKMT